MTNSNKADFLNYLENEAALELEEIGVNGSVIEFVRSFKPNQIDFYAERLVIHENHHFYSTFKLDVPFTDEDLEYRSVFGSFTRIETKTVKNSLSAQLKR